MKIAVEGCAHGELDNIYESIRLLEENENIKVDLLICCGDFQSSRNEDDLLCMAVPKKYQKLCSFYKYYNGEKTAPILTIFIGGNHEASNYLQELPYGGWVAPNIYYLGYANVINIAGVRIAGISGIYKGRDYMKGHFEKVPYDESTKRSVYHIRNLEVFRLKQLKEQVDVFLSHDWPTGITDYGNCKQLVKFKPFFKDDIESGKLGSPPCEELLNDLKPSYWFSAHLHCKFAALVPHSDDRVTKFLALDKCLPKRRFLQIVDVPHDTNLKIKISYDLEWLSILRNTNHLVSVKNTRQYMPGPNGTERWCFTPTKEEKGLVLANFDQNLLLPQNFVTTAPTQRKPNGRQPPAESNPQTKEFCKKLGIDDPLDLVPKSSGQLNLTQPVDLNITTSFIDDSEVLEHDDSANISMKSKKMTLPLPKNPEIDELPEVESSSCDSDEKNESVSDGEEKPDKDVFNVQKCDTPMSKKFKRRNAEIYDADDKV